MPDPEAGHGRKTLNAEGKELGERARRGRPGGREGHCRSTCLKDCLSLCPCFS